MGYNATRCRHMATVAVNTRRRETPKRMSSESRPRAGGETPTYIYNADRRLSNWRDKLTELYQYRNLLRNLVVRDLKARYKNSVLGILWSILNPLFLMGVFTIIFSVLANNQIRDYPIFVLTGLIPWNFFSGALVSGTTSVTGNSGLVKKVYFPRELLPVAAAFAADELGVPAQTILLLVLMIQFMAFGGALLFGKMCIRDSDNPVGLSQ